MTAELHLVSVFFTVSALFFVSYGIGSTAIVLLQTIVADMFPTLNAATA